MLNSKEELLTSEKLYGPVSLNLDVEAADDNPMILAEVPASSIRKDDVWFRSGWTVKDPKVHIAVALRSLQEKDPSEVTAFDSIRLGIYSALLSEAMEPKLFDLTAAGSSYSLSVGSGGITVSFVGYYEAFPNLIDQVFRAFNSFNENLNTTQQNRFERIVKTTKEALQTYGDMPSTYVVTAQMQAKPRNA
ncbi:unnamed protein product [Symbiodinium natans]|uniref:Peptidase M16 middle/third domain-containing protein n=1 Tax=Symbiodinium natans TaxID=878477 RepID=A0A812IAW6_9DINO|nr:unnamed protein product [Symbiodinium natans]